jgi:hypothetical protein
VNHGRGVDRDDKHGAAHAQQPNQGFVDIERRFDVRDGRSFGPGGKGQKDRRRVGAVDGDQAAGDFNWTDGEGGAGEPVSLAEARPALGRVDVQFCAHAAQYDGYDLEI